MAKCWDAYNLTAPFFDILSLLSHDQCLEMMSVYPGELVLSPLDLPIPISVSDGHLLLSSLLVTVLPVLRMCVMPVISVQK